MIPFGPYAYVFAFYGLLRAADAVLFVRSKARRLRARIRGR